MSINETKQSLRETMLRRRAALTELQIREASRAVCGHFLANLPMEKGERIGGYWPLPGEIDIRFLLESLEEERYTCALPVVTDTDKPLTYYRWHRGMELVPSAHFRILEPKPRKEVVIPTLLIVPLVAFDRRGGRLGFGRGFFDRTINALLDEPTAQSSLFTAGIAYSFQQVASVPMEDHDRRLDCVITEKGVIPCA